MDVVSSQHDASAADDVAMQTRFDVIVDGDVVGDVLGDTVPTWRVDVPTTEATAVSSSSPMQFEVIWHEVGELRLDYAKARFNRSRHADGSGVSVFRVGECVVENRFTPSTLPINDELYLQTSLGELPFVPTVAEGLAVSTREARYLITDPVAVRGRRPGTPMLWTFSAPVPGPIQELDGLPGFGMVPMPGVSRPPDDEFRLTWSRNSSTRFVRISFESQLFGPEFDVLDTSTISCTIPVVAGAVVFHPWGTPSWIENEIGYMFRIDSLEQYDVPYFDTMAQVTVVRRAAEFFVPNRR